MKMTKIIGLLLPFSLLAGEVSVEQLFNVQTIKVKKEQRHQQRKNYGYVTADQSRIYEISPRFGGYVVKLYADKLYKKVKKGEALVTVYSPEVFKAKDEYLNTYQYTQKRANKGMLESAKLKLQLLGIGEAEIKEVLDQSKALRYTTIYSPADGYLFMKNVEQGSAFNAKSKLFTIVNLDEVWVEAKILEEERKLVEQTKRYELSFKGLAEKYETNSVLLYPALDPKEARLTLRLQLKNPVHQLLPGMYASVYSISDTKVYLTLPKTAVIRKSGTYYVFVVGEFEGEYEPVEVLVAPLDTTSYQIIDGLKEGDEVVNNALFMMDSDAQINGLY